MRAQAKIFSSVLLMIFGAYMVPEHYLKYFHPHEHHGCNHLCDTEHKSFEQKHHDCNHEKTYFFPPVPELLHIEVIRPFLAAIIQLNKPLPAQRHFLSIPPRSPPAS